MTGKSSKIERRAFLSLAALPIWGAPTRPKLRVLTYNIHHGEGTDGKLDLQRIAGIIGDLSPDVVALQEVDNKTRRTGGVDQAAELSRLTGMNFAFGMAMPYQGGQYGEAVLSRFPLDRVRTYPLPFHPGIEPRAALRVRIMPDNGLPRFLFASTHLSNESEPARIEQAQQILRIFPASGSPPFVLAGDFNAHPESPPMKLLLDSVWKDAIAPQSEIDYVLFRASDAWKVTGVKIVDDLVASDHRPVLAVLEWQGATK